MEKLSFLQAVKLGMGLAVGFVIVHVIGATLMMLAFGGAIVAAGTHLLLK